MSTTMKNNIIINRTRRISTLTHKAFTYTYRSLHIKFMVTLHKTDMTYNECKSSS